MASYTVEKFMERLNTTKTGRVVEYIRQAFMEAELLGDETPVIELQSIVEDTIKYALPDNLIHVVSVSVLNDDDEYDAIPEMVGMPDVRRNTTTE